MKCVDLGANCVVVVKFLPINCFERGILLEATIQDLEAAVISGYARNGRAFFTPSAFVLLNPTLA